MRRLWRGKRPSADAEPDAVREKFLGSAAAFRAAEEARGRALDYDWQSAGRLDDVADWYVAQGWRSIPPEEMAIQMGAFLGECILRELGGAWRERDLVWDTELHVGQAGPVCWPFRKVRARLLPDSTDPIGQYLDHLRSGA